MIGLLKRIFNFSYRMLKLFVRHARIVDIFHEIVSFRRSNWLEEYITFNTLKGLKQQKILKKTSVKY